MRHASTFRSITLSEDQQAQQSPHVRAQRFLTRFLAHFPFIRFRKHLLTTLPLRAPHVSWHLPPSHLTSSLLHKPFHDAGLHMMRAPSSFLHTLDASVVALRPSRSEVQPHELAKTGGEGGGGDGGGGGGSGDGGTEGSGGEGGKKVTLNP